MTQNFETVLDNGHLDQVTRLGEVIQSLHTDFMSEKVALFKEEEEIRDEITAFGGLAILAGVTALAFGILSAVFDKDLQWYAVAALIVAALFFSEYRTKQIFADTKLNLACQSLFVLEVLSLAEFQQMRAEEKLRDTTSAPEALDDIMALVHATTTQDIEVAPAARPNTVSTVRRPSVRLR